MTRRRNPRRHDWLHRIPGYASLARLLADAWKWTDAHHWWDWLS